MHAVVGTKHKYCHVLLLPGCTWRLPIFVQNAAISLALLLFHAVIQPYENRRINTLDLFMYTNIILISPISLYNYVVLYAFYHSGVIHPTAFYIQVLLIYASMVTSQDGLSSAWHTFWKYIRGKDIKRYRQVPRSDSDPQISFNKRMRQWGNGGYVHGEALTLCISEYII